MFPSILIKDFLQGGGRIDRVSGNLHWQCTDNALQNQADEVFSHYANNILELMHDGDTWLDTTPSQRRFWLEDRLLEYPQCGYVPRGVMDCDTLLDPQKMALALQLLAQRHAPIRTNFLDLEGYPIQVVHEKGEWPLTFLDLRHLRDEALQERLRKETLATLFEHFDLRRAPVLRAKIIYTSDNSTRFVVGVHHIAIDGTAMGILWPEIYKAYHYGSQADFNFSELQYTHEIYLSFTREWAHSAVKVKAEEYWTKKLSDIEDIPSIPPLPERFCKGGGASTMLVLPMSDDIWNMVTAVAEASQSSKHRTLMALYFMYLQRVTGKNDIIVGTPYACRTNEVSKNLVGLCVNTLPIRMRVESEDSFSDVLKNLDIAMREAMEHGMLPFQDICDCARISSPNNQKDLIQSIFIYQNYRIDLPKFDGAQLITNYDHTVRYLNFNTLFEIVERNGMLKWIVTYQNSRYSESYFRDIFDQFQTLLRDALSNTQKPLKLLAILPQQQRNRLLIEWNATESEYPIEASLSSLFEAAAALYGHKCAVTSDGRSLKYRQLNERANQLARWLAAQGVGLGDIVALLLPRSPEVPIAMLAILKCGAAYLPLETDLPQGKIHDILEATNPKLVISFEETVELSQSFPNKFVSLHEHDEEIATQSRLNFPCPASGDDLAYIMFTSGSTGIPKGVAVSHANITRLVFNTNYFRYDAHQRWLMFASMAFDASTAEIWGALLHGANLIIPPPGMPTLHELGRFIKDNKITALFLTPTLFNQMVDNTLEYFSDVEQLMVGGDVLSVIHARRFLETFPGRYLWNGYGPTECTTYACGYPMRYVSDVHSPVPIGKPVSNTRLHVLDSHMNPVPVGVEGELYIAGGGVSKGYTNSPDANAKHFVSLQLPESPFPERVYKTGDLVRWLSDGNLEFLGRQDHQVKLNGFRVELGEIESALCKHPAISEAVVLLKKVRDDKRLVAFYTPINCASPTSDELVAHLSIHLAPALVPHFYQQLNEWPMGSTGKVDRQVLANREIAYPENELLLEPPMEGIEEDLANIWLESLKLTRVGRHENFFALGGHSLRATQLLSAIRMQFGVEIGFRTLSQKPSICQLAEFIKEHAPCNGNNGNNGNKDYNINKMVYPRNRKMAIEPNTTSGNSQWQAKFPMSFAQQRLWLINQMDPDSAAYNMPYFISLKGRLNIQALENALVEITMRHEALRTTFGMHEGQPMQRVSPKSSFHLLQIPRSSFADMTYDDIVQLEVSTEFAKLFDLENGPLFRGRLVEMGQEEHLLLLCMHHIISDGWSLGVFSNELSALYDDFSSGRPSSLPPLKVQYADFSIWQRDYLQGEIKERQVNYWMETLKGIERSDLPTNKPRPANLVFEANGLQAAIPQEITDKVKTFSQERNLTLFMVLLAGFYAIQHRYTGLTDLTLGSPIANRNRQEIEGLIGFFVNTLVLRTQLEGTLDFEELAKRVHATTLGAYDNQDLPFEYLVEKMNPERDSSRNPLFQVMFAVQNVPWSGQTFKGLQVDMLRGKMYSTRFDIEFHVWPDGEGLRSVIYYNSRLYEPWFIRQLYEQWLRLLDDAVSNPQKPIKSLRMMGEEELRRQVLVWNEKIYPYPKEKNIAQLFEECAAKHPNKKVLVSPYHSLTYGELNAWSNRLAHYLASKGVGLEDRVALLMNRNPMTVATIIGILKSGAAYVPIDVDFPINRIKYMVEDSNAKWVLTDTQSGVDLAELSHITLNMDSLYAELQEFPESNFTSPAAGNNLAYIMYTSGTTGTPKGVCVEHRNISRLVINADYGEFDESHIWLMFSPLAFDASTLELWGSLLHGATLAVYPSFLPSLNELATFIREYKVTSLFLTTSLFNQIVDQQLDDLSSIRQLFTGGEIMSVEHVQRFCNAHPAARISNVYGPTETTTFATHFPIDPRLEIKSPVPIGKPIANTTCHILDQYLLPTPPGVVGELCIGGAGVARGYLNNPELTKERFVEISLSGMKTPEKVYRTGDLVRFLPDGNIEFVGRADQQIKWRGFRIELGELESALRSHPDVSEAVVLLQEGAGNNKRLAAYVTLDEIFSSEHKEAEDQQVSHWLSLYDETYGIETEKAKSLENFLGWNSSYTGRPIPEVEMREWAESTSDRLKSHGAKRVLELGCGTGLLIGRIAPGTDSYVGIDFSEMVLKHTHALVNSREELKHVRLRHKKVDDLAEFSSEQFDLIILNSVIQYFPSVDYLIDVIRSAVSLLAPGGVLYLGDIRALPLHEHYTFSVQLHNAKDEDKISNILDAARRDVQREEELLLSPELFIALQNEFPQFSQVLISPKTGTHHNELSKFRYEVEIHTAPQSKEMEIIWTPWESFPNGLDDVSALLLSRHGGVLAVRGIPNARLSFENMAYQRLGMPGGEFATVAELRHMELPAAIEIDAVINVAHTNGFAIHIDWSDMAYAGAINAVFYPPGKLSSLPLTAPSVVSRPWHSYSNNPLQVIFAREVAPRLRDHLKTCLPDYMVPANYAVIEQFPLNRNGKIDRIAVARLSAAFSRRSEEYAPPRNDTEKFLAACFEELLGISQVGIRDNFFDLGGHSLLATQLISRIQEYSGKSIALRLFFEEPTISAFAPKVEQAPSNKGADGKPVAITQRAKSKEELLMERLSQLSEDELEKMLNQLGAENK